MLPITKPECAPGTAVVLGGGLIAAGQGMNTATALCYLLIQNRFADSSHPCLRCRPERGAFIKEADTESNAFQMTSVHGAEREKRELRKRQKTMGPGTEALGSRRVCGLGVPL